MPIELEANIVEAEPEAPAAGRQQTREVSERASSPGVAASSAAKPAATQAASPIGKSAVDPATTPSPSPVVKPAGAPAYKPPVRKPAARPADNPKILRFRTSERLLHWAIATPFLISMTSAIVMVLFYNTDPSRPHREVFSNIHRASGMALIFLPMLATLKIRGDVRIHLYNIQQAWTWLFDDFKWLALMGLAAVNPKIHLPEQGKFNAAEKINFMVLMVTYPLYVITGLMMWFLKLAILSWLLHFFMAAMALPLISGHLYMAVINPSSRAGLKGMITGFVDRQWAKHHYRRWYREHHEATEEALAVEEAPETEVVEETTLVS